MPSERDRYLHTDTDFRTIPEDRQYIAELWRRLQILDAIWTPRVNLLVIRCSACRRHFTHRADRWMAVCPTCKSASHLSLLRASYRQSHQRSYR